MKKIFAKELAALAVLALAFTGCNTAFEGTTANFAEKESEYTDRSGATQITPNNAASRGDASATGSIDKTNKKNPITVTIISFSKINIGSADEAIHFQNLSNNTANAAYYPVRGSDLTKTRIKVNEGTSVSGTFTTTITYEVDGTGVTANKVAFFVDATKLKTKGGSAVLALDGNVKRGEVSDSVIQYLNADGATTLTYTYGESFNNTWTPTGNPSANPVALRNAAGDLTGIYRVSIPANNKSKPGDAAAYDDISSKIDAVLQYREPGNRTYSEKKVTFTYHESAQTTIGDTWDAHSYTTDVGPFAVGTELRLVINTPDGLTAPAWYSEVYGHPATVYGAGSGVGAKYARSYGAYGYHKDLPAYITVNATQASTGTAGTYHPTIISKDDIKTAQSSFFNTVTITDNWFQVSTVTGVELDPAAAKDFIVVDANNKKIDADVDVITFSYNDSTAASGKVNYVKITLKDVRYRNYSSFTAANKTLKVLVGSGTKIKENKTYPSQLTFGQWKDVTDDDASGYVQIN